MMEFLNCCKNTIPTTTFNPTAITATNYIAYISGSGLAFQLPAIITLRDANDGQVFSIFNNLASTVNITITVTGGGNPNWTQIVLTAGEWANILISYLYSSYLLLSSNGTFT